MNQEGQDHKVVSNKTTTPNNTLHRARVTARCFRRFELAFFMEKFCSTLSENRSIATFDRARRAAGFMVIAKTHVSFIKLDVLYEPLIRFDR